MWDWLIRWVGHCLVIWNLCHRSSDFSTQYGLEAKSMSFIWVNCTVPKIQLHWFNIGYIENFINTLTFNQAFKHCGYSIIIFQYNYLISSHRNRMQNNRAITALNRGGTSTNPAKRLTVQLLYGFDMSSASLESR